MELSSIFQWNALIIGSVPGYLSVEAFRPLYDILVEQGEVTDCSDQRWAMGGDWGDATYGAVNPMVNIQKTMENRNFSWENPL